MKLQSSYIALHDVRFHAFHGVLPQERTVGNDYAVNLRVVYDISRAIATDRVEDTLNYAQLYEVIKTQMDVPSQLLEHVAGRIAQAVQDSVQGVREIELSITKLNPPLGADCGGASVGLHLCQDDEV